MACPPNTVLASGKLLQGLSDEGLRLKIIAYVAKFLTNTAPGTIVTPEAVLLRGKAMLALSDESIRVAIFRCLCIAASAGTCPVNTVLSSGKDFSRLSSRDQLICLAQLFVDNLELDIDPAKAYSALSQRAQWASIAILLDEFSNSTDSDPSVLIAAAKTATGASEYDQITLMQQEVCAL